MRKIALLIIVILISQFNTTPVSATVKCDKSGQIITVKKVKYICSRDKLTKLLVIKKYVESKNKSEVKSTIKVSDTTLTSEDKNQRVTNSVNNPTLTSNTNSESQIKLNNIDISSYLKMKDLLSNVAFSKNTKIDYIVDKELPKNVGDSIIREINKTVNLYTSLYPEKNISAKIYLYKTKNFNQLYDILKNELEPIALRDNKRALDNKLAESQSNPDGYYGGGAVGKDKNNNLVIFHYIGDINLDDIEVKHSFSHEMVHLYQRELINILGNVPCWMREGEATFLGHLITSRDEEDFKKNYISIFKSGKNDIKVQNSPKYTVEDWVNFFKEQEDKSILSCDDNYNYVLGALTYKYIYGNYSLEKITKFFKDLGSSEIDNKRAEIGLPTYNWKKIYEETFEIKLEDEYINYANFLIKEISNLK